MLVGLAPRRRRVRRTSRGARRRSWPRRARRSRAAGDALAELPTLWDVDTARRSRALARAGRASRMTGTRPWQLRGGRGHRRARRRPRARADDAGGDRRRRVLSGSAGRPAARRLDAADVPPDRPPHALRARPRRRARNGGRSERGRLGVRPRPQARRRREGVADARVVVEGRAAGREGRRHAQVGRRLCRARLRDVPRSAREALAVRAHDALGRPRHVRRRRAGRRSHLHLGFACAAGHDRAQSLHRPRPDDRRRERKRAGSAGGFPTSETSSRTIARRSARTRRPCRASRS